MLVFQIPEILYYDESNEKLFTNKPFILRMEHSLLSIAKWESIWHIPFLGTNAKKTEAQMLDYLRQMTVFPDESKLPKWVYQGLPASVIREIAEYIDSPRSATKIYQSDSGKGNKEPMTSELIYYWMVANQIPFTCEKWHLNRLLTLINICSIKNSPRKKLSRQEIMRRNTMLNAERRARLNSHG